MSQDPEIEKQLVKAVSMVPLRLCNGCLQIKGCDEFNKGKHLCRGCSRQYDKDRDAAREQKFKSGELVHPDRVHCKHCEEVLPAKYFTIHYHTTTGYANICKYHAAMKSIIRKAKKKVIEGVSNLMTRDEYFKILDGICYYCGSKENIGVDRIDSNKGYTKVNCISCCSMCNYMKSDYKFEDFIAQCYKIAEYQKVSLVGL